MTASIDTLQKGTGAYYVGGDLIAYIHGKHIVLARMVDGITVLTPEGSDMARNHDPLDGDWSGDPGGSLPTKKTRKPKAAEVDPTFDDPSPVDEVVDMASSHDTVSAPEEPTAMAFNLDDILSVEDKLG